MPEFIRVKDKDTKHEYSIVESTFDADAHEKLKKDAVQADGQPLPPKHYVDPKSLSSSTRGGESATASAGQKATSDKEAS